MKYFLSILILVVLGASIYSFINKSNGDPNETSNNSGQVKGAILTENKINQNIKKISVQDAIKMIKENKDNDNLVLLDIRTPEEFKEGNIKGSINIDFYNGFIGNINSLNKNKKYLIYCRTGNRTGQALKLFERNGFKEVYDMEGGYEAWTGLNN